MWLFRGGVPPLPPRPRPERYRRTTKAIFVADRLLQTVSEKALFPQVGTLFIYFVGASSPDPFKPNGLEIDPDPIQPNGLEIEGSCDLPYK